jgi:acyl carrier protein
MLQRIQEIVADVTQNSVNRIKEDSSQKNVEGWDSMAQINILVTVESEFNVSFSPEELHSLDSVQKIAQALTSLSGLPSER